MIWLMIFMMAGITFYCRFMFFSSLLSFSLSGPLKRMLHYTAPSVLTAMWVPIVFMSDNGQFTSGLDDPFLVAGIGTVVLSLITHRTLLVVGLGMGLFAVAKLMLQ